MGWLLADVPAGGRRTKLPVHAGFTLVEVLVVRGLTGDRSMESLSRNSRFGGQADFQRSRAGFTWVELLVVIGILGFLVAMLLPTIRNAREAARRSQCNCNLKQIGLGLQTYADVNKSFPYDALWGRYPNSERAGVNGNDEQLAYHFPWSFMILPQIEQVPLYNAVNKRLPIWNQSQEFGTAGVPKTAPPLYFGYTQSQQVPSYRCPSDGTFTGPGDLPSKCMWFNYAGSVGVGFYSAVAKADQPGESETAAPLATRGMFAFNEPAGFGMITDGTSNTICVAEVTAASVAAPVARGGTTYNTSLSGDLVFAADAPQPLPPDWKLPRAGTVWSPPPLAAGGAGKPRMNLRAAPGGTMMVPMVFRSATVAFTEKITGTGPCSAGIYTAAQGGPCGVATGKGTAGFEFGGMVGQSPIVGIAPLYNAIYSPNSNWPGPSGNHPGIILVAFADGHTSQIQENIAFNIWASLNTRQGGEKINGDF